MNSPLHDSIDTPAVWHAGELLTRPDWLCRIGVSEVDELIRAAELPLDEITRLERHIRQLSAAPRYATAHAELRKIPGVGLLTAMTFLTEMGDLTRFSNRRQVAAYLGLCPASFESGENACGNGAGRAGKQRGLEAVASCDHPWSIATTPSHR